MRVESPKLQIIAKPIRTCDMLGDDIACIGKFLFGLRAKSLAALTIWSTAA
jgi:hypothetical protein